MKEVQTGPNKTFVPHWPTLARRVGGLLEKEDGYQNNK